MKKHMCSCESSPEPNTSSEKDEPHTSSTVRSPSYASSSDLSAAKEEMSNLDRVLRRLMGPCTDQLRDLLRFHIPQASFPTVIQRDRSRLPCLTESQRKLILPNTGVYSGNYDDMDIFLLYILLRKSVESKRTIKAGGAFLTPQTDRRRRTLSGFNSEFNQVWSEIRAAVGDLDNTLGNGNKYQEEMDFIQNDRIDPDIDKHYKDHLLKIQKVKELIKSLESEYHRACI